MVFCRKDGDFMGYVSFRDANTMTSVILYYCDPLAQKTRSDMDDVEHIRVDLVS